MVGPELAKIAGEAATEQSRLSTARMDGALPLVLGGDSSRTQTLAWKTEGRGGPLAWGVHGRCTAMGPIILQECGSGSLPSGG